MENTMELEKELISLGLIDKAREIYSELGEKAVISYIKSSYRLLSKIAHPDLNPENREKATMIQQRLNRINHIISQINDKDIVFMIKKGIKKQTNEKRKILVVEDEFGLQELFKDIFLMEGYDVRTATDGDRGYKVYCEFLPDLIFTDVVMPGMNGMELIAMIRETNPQIKVIYISGFFGLKRVKKKLDEEIFKYQYPTLSKPFQISVMLDMVKEYLNK